MLDFEKQDPKAELLRIRGRARQDDSTGWVTVRGAAGAALLAPMEAEEGEQEELASDEEPEEGEADVGVGQPPRVLASAPKARPSSMWDRQAQHPRARNRRPKKKGRGQGGV